MTFELASMALAGTLRLRVAPLTDDGLDLVSEEAAINIAVVLLSNPSTVTICAIFGPSAPTVDRSSAD